MKFMPDNLKNKKLKSTKKESNLSSALRKNLLRRKAAKKADSIETN